MRIQLVRRGLDRAKAHLQPGLYLDKVARSLGQRGYDARVLDGIAGRPDVAVWCLGPTSFLRDAPRRIRASAPRVVAFVPGPLYTSAQLRRNLGPLRWTHAGDHAVHLAMAALGLKGFARGLAACADTIVVPTRTLKAQLVAAGLPEGSVHVVPCGLDPLPASSADDRSEALLETLAIDGGSGGFVVNFGPIRPVRGVDTLVEAAPHLPSGLRVLVLARAGDGDPARDLAWLGRRIARAAAGDRVVVHQASLDRATLLGVVRRAQAAAFPLRLVQSVQPAAVHEAFQAGVPAALSDVPPLGELADGLHARTFPVGDAPALANALADLCSRRPEASAACRAWVERQPTWPQAAQRLEALMA